ncbi:MAG: alpha-ribazole phosphatase [Bacillota bacterium]|nr:alpha-ribazole phosphatase [Bacillota bacterium]
MKLYLIRHGETKWNSQLRYQGHTDVELSHNGHMQGKQLGERMAQLEPTAIYASDLSRAYQTAEYIAVKHNKEVKKSALLRELNFGIWEGLTFKEINQQHQDLATNWYKDPINLQIPNGELFADMQKRVLEFIDYLKANYTKDTIVIVSHGGTIRTIICSLLGIDLKKMWSLKQDNTAVNILDFYDDHVVLSLLNDTHHIKEKNN